MSNLKRKPQEISLIDVFWSLLYHWRSLLLVALLLMLVMGGVGLSRNNTSQQSTQSSFSTEVEGQEVSDYLNLLPDWQQVAVNVAVDAQIGLDECENYKKESIYINLDAYHENICTLTYLLETEDSLGTSTTKEKSATVLKEIYLNYFASGALAYDIVWEGKEITQAALSELILFSDQIEFSNNQLGTDYEQFSVNVLGSSEADAEELAGLVDKQLKIYTEKIKPSYGNYKLTLLSTEQGCVVDKKLLNAQKELNGTIIGNRNNLNTTLSTFTEQQRWIFDGLVKLERGEALSVSEAFSGNTVLTTTRVDVSLKEKVSLFVKYGIIGGFVGLFCAALFWSVLYIFTGTIKMPEDIENSLGYFVIADLSVFKNKTSKKCFAGIDRWIDSVRARHRGSYEDEMKLLLTNLKALCKKNGVEKLHLASSGKAYEGLVCCMELVEKELEKENVLVSISYMSDRNNKAYEEMMEAGTVVFFETMKQSLWEGMLKMEARMEKQEVKVLGVVTL